MSSTPTDIVEFTSALEDLIDDTEASYIEIIGTLELAKQRLLNDALPDDYEDDEEDDDEDDYDDDEDYEDDDWES
ncbi:MAG: hypothetical protein AAGI15_09280 [Pseudomonadota bacterium]